MERTYRKPLVYVAGPYTRPDPVANTHAIIKLADAVMTCGVTPVVPHLSLLWHVVSPKPYEDWLALDIDIMERCDAVLRVPGASSGADGEVDHAEKMGIPVLMAESSDAEGCIMAVNAWLHSRR